MSLSAQKRAEEVVPAGQKVMAAAAGSNHSAAVGEDGSLFVWGCNYYGQLGTDDTAERLAPTPSPGCPRPCGRSRLGTILMGKATRES